MPVLGAQVRAILEGVGDTLGLDGCAFAAARPIEIDDSFVGAGYGILTPASREAQQLAARTDALFLDLDPRRRPWPD
jgi:hypothetical protein